ncbi:uncharacterized protein L3040_008368 [Drepanopeziza brunnea f. sp. 'multigermtubi']|uniref:uncharacterized protein n=1 Tax=Drepanopeziza brunnea f. sp. 'multigermtubi' TaxID=698441 RepID=UPI002382D0C3|nr:hypothetical protein L3040_008368 [Drepanopeziza brunnea f. sp. 'multigermtubi']
MAMAPEILTFMPNGDVTLKLIRHVVSGANPNAPRSITDKPSKAEEPVLDEDAEIEAALGIEPETLNDDEDDGIVFYAPDAPGAEDGPFYPPTPRARGSDASRRDRSASPPASFWAALKRQAAQVIGDPVAVEDDAAVSEVVQDAQGEVEMAVVESHEAWCICSSRHLMLSSRYFETILSGEFKEAKTLRTTGQVVIEFWEDDLDSMVILLNIIHGASRKVPRTLGTDNLTKLAVLVSKFGMLETVDFFSDTWIDNLQREGLPKGYNKDILKMLYVFWVFDREKEFGDMTRLVQREADEKIEEDVKGLMIPSAIVDAIKHARVSAISTAIDTVHALIIKFMDGTDHCDAAIDDDLRYACDAMVLGSLLKSSRKIGIWPKPEAPFLGRRWRDLAKKLRGIKVLDVCNKTSSRRWNSHGPSGNAHGIEDEIEGVLKDVEKGLEGLNLKDFAGKSEDCIPVLVPEAEVPHVPDVPAPVVDAPASTAAHEHSDSVPEPQMTGSFAPDSQISCHTDEGVDVEPSEYEEYYDDPSKHVPSIDHTVLADQRELDDDPAPPMHIIETINIQEPAPSPPPELALRFDSPPRPQPPQAPRTRGRSPPRANVREEKAQPEMKEAHSSPSLFSWPKNDFDDTPGHEVAIIPKSQLSNGFLYQEARPRDLSPRNNIHDVPTRKAVPTTNFQQDYRLNGSTTPPTTVLNEQIHHSPPAPSTNGTDLRLKSSPRNSIQGAAFPKPAPVPPPHQSPHTSPNGQTTPTESQSSKNGSPTSYFPSYKEQEAYAQRKPQALLRHNTNEKPPIPKSTQVPPLSQNNLYNNNPTASAYQRPRRANSIPLPPSPREESQPARDSATSKLMAAEKHIARNFLYHAASNGAGREDVRSPAPVSSRASSIDDAVTMDNSVALLSPPARIPAPVNGTATQHHHRHEERNGRSPPRALAPTLTHDKTSTNNEHRPEERNGERHRKPGNHAPALAPIDRDKEREKRSSTHNNTNTADRVAAQRKSPSPPAMAMAAVNKGREARPETNGRESPLKQMMTSGDENDELGGEVAVRDMWSPPKEGFRVRKGKKVFTNRFSS